MSADNDGRLAHNILLFSRTLRSAGLTVGTGQVLDALRAVSTAGIERRDEFYWTLRAILVKSPAQRLVFDQAFQLYFRNPRLLQRLMALLLPTISDPGSQQESERAIRRLLEVVAPPQGGDVDGLSIEIDQSNTASDREKLREKDFEQMSLQEQRDASKLLIEDLSPLRQRPARRFRADARGGRYDLRRSLRLMQRSGSDFLPLARRQRVKRTPDLVLICDISGSMSSYSRMFLLFSHALTQRESIVHSFVFGTRLTCISHHLKMRDVDQSMQQIGNDVLDWDGGTRIAACLDEFNRRWTRRVLSRDAVVILLSDGLERDEESDLEFQMSRLRRSCRHLIWMNPLLRYEDFEPKAQGIRKMLPHIDQLVPAHNVQTVTGMWAELCNRPNGTTVTELEPAGGSLRDNRST